MHTARDHLQWIISNADTTDLDNLGQDIPNQDVLNRGKLNDGFRLTSHVLPRQFIPPIGKWKLDASWVLETAAVGSSPGTEVEVAGSGADETQHEITPDNIKTISQDVQVKIRENVGMQLYYTAEQESNMQKFFQNLHKMQILKLEQEFSELYGPQKSIKKLIEGLNKTRKTALFDMVCPHLMSWENGTDGPRLTGALKFLTQDGAAKVPSKYEDLFNAALYSAFQTPAKFIFKAPPKPKLNAKPQPQPQPQPEILSFTCMNSQCPLYRGTIEPKTTGSSSKKVVCGRCRTTMKSHNAGQQACELKKGGFAISELVRVGIQKKNIATAGYSAQDLTSHNFSAKTLKEAAFGLEELLDAGWKPAELKHTYSAENFVAVMDRCNMKRLGFKIQDLKSHSLQTQKKAGFDLSDIVSSRQYSVDTLLESLNVSIADCKKEGVPVREFKAIEKPVASLKAAGYTASDLKEANYLVEQLKTGGFSVGELRKANYTVDQLAEDFTGKELKDGGFTAKELIKSKSFFLQDVKELFTLAEVWSSKEVTAPNLKDAGYTIKELISENVPLLPAGFLADEFKEAGITIKELQEDHDFTRVHVLESGFEEGEITWQAASRSQQPPFESMPPPSASGSQPPSASQQPCLSTPKKCATRQVKGLGPMVDSTRGRTANASARKRSQIEKKKEK